VTKANEQKQLADYITISVL